MSVWADFFRNVDPAVFWQAASAISTFLAVVVALVLPVTLRANEARLASKQILFELHQNRAAAQRILNLRDPKEWEHGDIDSGIRAEIIRSTHGYLSWSVWEAQRHKISVGRFKCYNEAYEAFRGITRPDDVIITLPEQGGPDAKVYSIAEAAISLFDELCENCRYFR